MDLRIPLRAELPNGPLHAAIVAAGGCSFGGGERKLVAYFQDVGDLGEGSTVQIADVEVCIVEDIDLMMQDGEMFARVTMTVSDSTDVRADGLGSGEELQSDIAKLRVFLEANCNTRGETGDVRGEGSP